MLRAAVTLAACLALLPAGAASAQTCKAPPGTAAVDEYCETVPTARGDRGSGDPSEPVALPQQTARELARSGTGSALLRQLGHDGRTPSRKSGGSAKPGSGAAAPVAPSNNPLDAVGAAVSSGPTLGTAFVAALLAVTLAMLAWGWIAYRRRAGD